MNKLFLSISVLLFFCTCTNKQLNNEGDQILLNVGDKPDNSQKFNTFFELDLILPIETTDDYLMTELRRVIAHKDKLIILDRGSNIFIVNATSGKIEKLIRHIGLGPGESRLIIDITIDEDRDNILAFNDYNQLLFFDLDGNFLMKETFKELYGDAVYDKGYVNFYNYGDGYDCHPYAIGRYSLQNKTMETIGDNRSISFPVRLYGRHIVKSKNIWFGSPLDFDLFCLKNNKIENPYRLQPKTAPITKELMESSISDPSLFYKKVSENNVMFGICSIRETEQYLIFRSRNGCLFLLNKTTNEIYWEDVIKTKQGFNLYNYFPHEGDDNRVMFVLSAGEWVNFYKRNPSAGIPTELMSKIDSFKIEEDSNPILFFYKEKKKE